MKSVYYAKVGMTICMRTPILPEKKQKLEYLSYSSRSKRDQEEFLCCLWVVETPSEVCHIYRQTPCIFNNRCTNLDRRKPVNVEGINSSDTSSNASKDSLGRQKCISSIRSQSLHVPFIQIEYQTCLP